MTATITADQIRDLWTSGSETRTIDRGDDLAPVTRADIIALCEGGEVDWDDDDNEPTASGYELLADALNANKPGAPTSTPASLALAAVEEISSRRRATVARLDEERDTAIRAAITAGVPVSAIAAAADLHRQRVYQIRDGRR